MQLNYLRNIWRISTFSAKALLLALPTLAQTVQDYYLMLEKKAKQLD